MLWMRLKCRIIANMDEIFRRPIASTGKKIPLCEQGWEDYFVGVKYMKSCALIVSMQDG